MSVRIVSLDTPTRNHVVTGGWWARWTPDTDDCGGELEVRVTVGGAEVYAEVTVLQVYRQGQPADDATVQRWAYEVMAGLVDGWRLL